MDLVVRANQKAMKEARDMCDALKELFADELEEEAKKREKRLTSLIYRLLNDNRVEDIRRVSEDEAFRALMYREYGL
ncbi:hypothetical protein LI276_00155 [[Clostridium] scindens]|nr:hypothetical protein [[Clostridium] scindens]